MAGDAGGVLEVEAVVGDAALGSAATGALFTTSADMVPSEPRRTSRRSVVGGRGGRITQTAAAPCFRGQRGQTEQMTPQHPHMVFLLFVWTQKK